MTVETQAPAREKSRIFITGSCEGLPELWDALGRHGEIELVGRSDQVREGAGALTGGHLQAVLHATRSSALPADELAAIREYSQAPIVLLASGESSALLEEALDADVADVILLPQLTENVVFAIRKASHSGRRAQSGRAQGAGRVITVFSPKGGTGKTVMATNLSTSFAKFAGKKTLLLDLDLQFGDAAIMLGIEPDKTIQDLVTAPGELDTEKLAGYICRHSSGLDVLPAPIRPEDAELVTEAKLARLMEVAKESYDADRRRHITVLPRADAGDARPDRRPTASLRARRADDQERPAKPPDARAPLLPTRANSRRAQSRELECRHEARRGRGCPGSEGPRSRSQATEPSRSQSTARTRRSSPTPKSDFARALREMAKSLLPTPAATDGKRRFLGRSS